MYIMFYALISSYRNTSIAALHVIEKLAAQDGKSSSDVGPSVVKSTVLQIKL